MIVLVCVLTSGWLLATNLPQKGKFHIMSYSTDTIKTSALKFSSKSATVAGSADGMRNLLDSVKAHPDASCLVVSRIDGNRWLLNNNPEMNRILKYDAKKVTVLQGDIYIMGVRYSQKYAVIME